MWTILIDWSILLLHPLSQVGMESVFPYLWFHSESLLVPVASPESKRNFIKTKTGNTFQKQYYNTFISGRCLYSIELICDPFMQMDYINYLLKLQIFSVAFNLSLENSRIGNSFQHFSTTRNCLLLLHPSWFLSENWFYYCFSWINFGIIYDSYCVWVFLLIRYASPDLTVCISTRVQIRGGAKYNII